MLLDGKAFNDTETLRKIDTPEILSCPIQHKKWGKGNKVSIWSSSVSYLLDFESIKTGLDTLLDGAFGETTTSVTLTKRDFGINGKCVGKLCSFSKQLL